MPQSQTNSSSLLLALAIAIVLHVLCIALWGAFYGEYADQFFTAYIDGSFTAGATKPLFYNYGIIPGSSQLIAWAYEGLPAINWYGIARQCFMLLNTVGLVWLLLFAWRGFKQHRWLGAAVVFFLGVFWCYHIVWPRLTELAFLACGIGVIGIVATYTVLAKENFANVKAPRIFFVILLLLSVHFRVESALMGAFIFAPLALWVGRDRAAWKGFLKISLVVVPVFLGSYLLYLSATGPAEKLFQESRVYTYTIWDFGQENHPFHLASAADSVKLEATNQFFIADEEGMSPAFYERVGVLPREKSIDAISGYFEGFGLRVERAMGIWGYYTHAYTSLFFYYLAALAFCIGLLAWQRQFTHLLVLVVVQFWFWLVLFGVTVFMKMELHVFAPLLTLAYIVLLLSPLVAYGRTMVIVMPRIVMVAILLLAIPTFFKLHTIHQRAQGFKTGKENIQIFKAELQQFNNHIVVFNNLAWLLLYEDFFDTNEYASHANFLSIDNGELFMYPEFKQAMTACCNGYKVDEIARYLLENKERVIFVSHNDRMDLLQRYIETVYGIPFKTKPAFPESILNHPKGGKMIPGYTDHIDYAYYVFE